MKNSIHFRNFLEQYQHYVHYVLEPTYDELKTLFESWESALFWDKYSSKGKLPTPSPIQRTILRIKSPESVVDKILRKSEDYPENLSFDSLKKMSDALAGRIVVYFLSDLPLIDREIQNSEVLEISQVEKPVAYLSRDLISRLGLTHIENQQKESGYTSIHYVLRFRESAVPVANRPWFEIQVRTLVGDIWGEIEHILGYKPGKHTSFAVRKQFQILASQLTAIDEHFNFLYTELSRFQEIVSYDEGNPLNAENLPAVLNEIGVNCAQKEIDGLLKILSSRKINTVGELLTGGTITRIEIIRNVFIGHTGRTPTNEEIVSSLAAIKDIEDESAIVEAIKARIDYLDTWSKVRQHL